MMGQTPFQEILGPYSVYFSGILTMPNVCLLHKLGSGQCFFIFIWSPTKQLIMEICYNKMRSTKVSSYRATKSQLKVPGAPKNMKNKGFHLQKPGF